VAEDDGSRPGGPMPWVGDTRLSRGVQFCVTVGSHQRARINIGIEFPDPAVPPNRTDPPYVRTVFDRRKGDVEVGDP
jgi:hypothetical protein